MSQAERKIEAPQLTAEDTAELEQAFKVAEARATEARMAGLAHDAAQSRVQAAAFKLMALKRISPEEYNLERQPTGEFNVIPVVKADAPFPRVAPPGSPGK
jgi:hypothetical protein